MTNITKIEPAHHAAILRLNARFVHWLAPMDAADLEDILSRTAYARRVGTDSSTQAVLFGYAHDVDYPEHKNLAWLRGHLDNFFYIDRVIIDADSHGQGLGRALYDDVAAFARARGHSVLACEVNTVPDNPGSHAFHLRLGFEVLGEQSYPEKRAGKGVTVRYYAKAL